jgi:GNAT superfamily N-acetyltransferase/uncharacterized glyoxalase superfamily protein PhnB
MTQELQPVFSHAEPVLSVSDVTASIRYWQDVLGFPGQWTWGDPPIHGGVSWHGAFIQFSYNPELAKHPHGQYIWVRVQHIEVLYQLHQERKADIVSPLKKQGYGFDEYTVRDLNGYYISFAAPSNGKKGVSVGFPDSVRIVGRAPSPAEYRSLMNAVGWTNDASDAELQTQLDAVQYAVVAENTESGQVIGCALLLGDGFGFYYVKDVVVDPGWQRKRVGTALMQELTRWLDQNAPDKAMVGLFTVENLSSFYRQAHFEPAFGMVRTIDRKK